MHKNAVKKLPFVIKYDLDRCKTHEMCNKAVSTYHSRMQFIPEGYKSEVICGKSVDTGPFVFGFVSDRYMTQETCDKVVPKEYFKMKM